MKWKLSEVLTDCKLLSFLGDMKELHKILPTLPEAGYESAS